MSSNFKRATVGTALAAVLAASIGAAVPSPALAQSPARTYRPTQEVLLSVGEGQLVSLPRSVSDVWTSNAAVADVNVNNPRQIGLFGKDAGEATIIATAADGTVVYGAHVRVSQNISSINEMLQAAMPEAKITVTQVGQMAVINGTVASPEDSAQAEQLVRMILNPGIDASSPGAALKIFPVNRLKTATPLQVMLQVKIAEVSRSLIKEIGVNLLTRDVSGGFLFGISRGRDIGTIADRVSDSIIDPATGNPAILGTDFTFKNPVGAGTAINAAGRLFGLDILSALDLAETDGRVTTLAEPNLTALSGETASFLAGGEFPIATSNGINGTSIEFKQYGVSLAFSPTVLDGGRISMRVRPEVSELSSEGAIKLNGLEIPALTTRRAETTVELGSGQSFMIGGLMRNSSNNSVDKAPFLGDVPILGALFRSSSFRRNETELVIIVTPYLVKPVSAGEIALPTDGFRLPSEVGRLLLDERHDGVTGAERPQPSMGSVRTVTPGLAPYGAASPQPAPVQQARSAGRPKTTASASPGFSF